MKERPIFFSAPMIRALLDGSKTQTRRVIPKQAPAEATSAGVISTLSTEDNGLWAWLSGDPKDCDTWGFLGDGYFRCSYGVPGDFLWVRESWAARLDQDHLSPSQLPRAGVGYWADGPGKCCNTGCAGAAGRVRASMHMPRWASRITLRITDVRVERLTDISREDAIAEGIEYNERLDPLGPCKWRHYLQPNTGVYPSTSSFATLWESINGPHSFAKNPWVWAISFERVTP